MNMIVYDKCDWPLTPETDCGVMAPVRWCRVEERAVCTCEEHMKLIEREAEGHANDMPMTEEEYALWKMSSRKTKTDG